MLSVKQRMKTLTRDVLYDLYIRQEKSLGDIAEIYQCSRVAVHKRLQKFQLPARTKSQARLIALDKEKFEGKQRKNFDEAFFAQWSNEMAWVLGLLFTDGCLHNSRATKGVSFAQKDLGLLKKVLNLLQCDAKIYKPSNHVPGFSLNSDQLYEQLISLGLTPRKSLTMQFPDVPEPYVRHFIRGCWDGDGSVFYGVNNNRPTIRASYVCGSLSFITVMAAEFKKAGFPERTIYHGNGRQSYSFRFNGGEQCYQLFRYFYDNVPETQYLKRKYLKFKNFFIEQKI